MPTDKHGYTWTSDNTVDLKINTMPSQVWYRTQPTSGPEFIPMIPEQEELRLLTKEGLLDPYKIMDKAMNSFHYSMDDKDTDWPIHKTKIKNVDTKILKLSISCCEFILNTMRDFELQALYTILIKKLRDELDERQKRT